MIDFETGRPVTMAPRGVVTSPHSLASAAGVEILKAGGSAVDAAIATSAALAVLYPHMTSVGGDAFWLIYDARAGTVRYLGGGGRAAASATIEAFARRGLSEIPYRGVVPATLTVPGGVASWCEAHTAYGRLPLARNLEAAIGYARDGFPVTARLARWIEATAAEGGVFDAAASAIFMPGGTPPRTGAKLANPDLARTLEAIAGAGRDGFYGGETARELARYARENGGFFDEADLRAQDAAWDVPLLTTYRGVKIYETPAPTQGFTVLEMLNLLEALRGRAVAFSRPGPRPSSRAGEADRLSRSRPAARGSRVSPGADRPADLARVRRRTPQADRPRPRARLGPGALRTASCKATPSSSPSSMRTATRFRSSKVSTESSAPASSRGGLG